MVHTEVQLRLKLKFKRDTKEVFVDKFLAENEQREIIATELNITAERMKLIHKGKVLKHGDLLRTVDDGATLLVLGPAQVEEYISEEVTLQREARVRDWQEWAKILWAKFVGFLSLFMASLLPSWLNNNKIQRSQTIEQAPLTTGRGTPQVTRDDLITGMGVAPVQGRPEPLVDVAAAMGLPHARVASNSQQPTTREPRVGDPVRATGMALVNRSTDVIEEPPVADGAGEEGSSQIVSRRRRQNQNPQHGVVRRCIDEATGGDSFRREDGMT